MPSSEKTRAVAEISERFTSSSAAVITEYRGLSVKQLTDLRRALGRETTYAVVKNTLTKRAAADAGVPIDEQVFIGPTAIAFINGDPVAAAKGLRDFARANPLLVIKGGILEGKALSADEVNRIADLESREVLLARVAGVLKALPTRAAGLFQAPLSQMARLARALEEKRSAEAPTSDAAQAPAGTETAAEAPAATETPAEAPAATETPAEPAE
jgi:large subunit ribosomal protein L10